MNNRFRIFDILLCFVILLFSGCETDDPIDDDIPVDRTVLVYLLANNNLSSDMTANVNAMISAAKKGILNGGNLLVYMDNRSGESTLHRITSNGREVVKEYGERNSASSGVLREVIEDVMTMYPAGEYGLIFGGHGSGWMDINTTRTLYRAIGFSENERPLTRAYGVDGNSWMTIEDMAKGIPDNTFHFILFDACYMAGVEVAYALRHKTDFFIASGTEIMGAGYPYEKIIPYMYYSSLYFEDICDAFYQYYQGRNATTGIIDCREMESLARIIRKIRTEYPERYDSVSIHHRNEIQQFGRYVNRDSDFRNRFYDLSDFIFRIIHDDEELAQEYTAQMELTVPYIKSSSYFLDLPINKYCGLSTYIPLPGEINDYYYNLEWSKAINN